MNKSKYIVKPTSQFKKDYKSAIKRNMNIKALDDVIKKLSNGERLEEQYRDHTLSGQWSGHRECHIEPDWLLIYFIKKMFLFYLLPHGLCSKPWGTFYFKNINN